MYVAIHMLLVSRLTDVNRVCQCGRTRRSEARVARSAPPRAAAPPRGPTGSSSATSPSDDTERARCDTFAWEGKGDARNPGGRRESRQNVQGDPFTPGRAATLPRASHCRDPCYFSFGGVCASFAACLNRATGQRQTFAFDDLRLTPYKPPPSGTPCNQMGHFSPTRPRVARAPVQRIGPLNNQAKSWPEFGCTGWARSTVPARDLVLLVCVCNVCVIAFLF
jgi:hypothetical protein